MAYTSVIPVHRLDRSIEYVKDKEKTTQKADSLEAAIDYACVQQSWTTLAGVSPVTVIASEPCS